MRFFLKLFLIFAVCAVVPASRAAHAATPTSTPTSTATSGPTATPAANQVSTFIGSCWFYGRPCSGQMVTARIGGKVCATSSAGVAPADSVNRMVFTVNVPSQHAVGGCGREGAEVDFFVGDLQTNQSGVWHAQANQTLLFIAGPPFALISGTLDTDGVSGGIAIVAYVNDNPCGYVIESALVQPSYEAVVFSNDQQRGCGTEGAPVTFKLVDAHMNALAVASQSGVWHGWDGSNEQSLNLTFAPVSSVTMGNTGTGDRGRTTESPWGTLAAVLSGVGLIGLAAGVALGRPRAT